jgi:hypothetical protein
MEIDVLAQGLKGLDDWIQIIVIIMVIGASAFGAISKKLIKAFTPEEPDEAGAKKPPAEQAPPLPKPVRRSAPPARPVARPMPGAPRSDTSTFPPVARPVPPRPVRHSQVEQRRDLLAEAEPPPVRTPQPQPVARPAPTPAPRPAPAPEWRERPAAPHKPPRPTRIEKSVDRVGARVREEERQFESAIDERVGILEPAVVEEVEEFDAAIDDRMGHIGPEGSMPQVARRPSGRAPFFGRPTASELQHAVLMREILGPPVALRRHEDRF